MVVFLFLASATGSAVQASGKVVVLKPAFEEVFEKDLGDFVEKLKKEASPETRADQFVALNRLATGLHGDYPLGAHIPNEKEAQLYLHLAAVTAGFAPQIPSTWVEAVLKGAHEKERAQFAIMQNLAQFIRGYALNTAEGDRQTFAQSHVTRRKLAKTLPPKEERLINLFLENSKGFAPFLLASAVGCTALIDHKTLRARPIRTFTDPIVIPSNPRAFFQADGREDSACNLFAFLAPALQKKEMRAIIAKILVYQDDNYAYFKFPDFPKEVVITKLQGLVSFPNTPSDKLSTGEREEKHEVEQLIKNIDDGYVKPSALVYKVKKDIHTSSLLPTEDPWVNLFSKAYFEYTSRISGFKGAESYSTFLIS